jgi:hypothetical protein
MLVKPAWTGEVVVQRGGADQRYLPLGTVALARLHGWRSILVGGLGRPARSGCGSRGSSAVGPPERQDTGPAGAVPSPERPARGSASLSDWLLTRKDPRSTGGPFGVR